MSNRFRLKKNCLLLLRTLVGSLVQWWGVIPGIVRLNNYMPRLFYFDKELPELGVTRDDLVISVTLQGISFSICSHKPVWAHRDKRKFEFDL